MTRLTTFARHAIVYLAITWCAAFTVLQIVMAAAYLIARLQ